MSDDYEIRVHGEASVSAIESLSADVEMKAFTVLRGVVEDQAALHALLAQLRDIGLEIVNLRRIS